MARLRPVALVFAQTTPAQWPRGAKRTEENKRRHSPFKAPWDQTLRELRNELSRVHAAGATIGVDCPMIDIRQDGLPRGDARVRSPGVVLRFTHPTAGELVYPCDTYRDWQDNVRAIMLTLGRLRDIERYGAVAMGQQYAGFKAIAASSGEVRLTADQAAEVIAKHSGIEAEAVFQFPSVARTAIRQAKRAAHPDNGGSDDAFALVCKAESVLTESLELTPEKEG